MKLWNREYRKAAPLVAAVFVMAGGVMAQPPSPTSVKGGALAEQVFKKNQVLKGTTDAKGVWTFPAPPPGVYTVRATADGHAAKTTFTIVAPDAPAAEGADPATDLDDAGGLKLVAERGQGGVELAAEADAADGAAGGAHALGGEDGEAALAGDEADGVRHEDILKKPGVQNPTDETRSPK